MSGRHDGADLHQLGKTVRDARRKKRVTLVELAKASGVSKSVLSQVERGTTNPTLAYRSGRCPERGTGR
ncbi:MAG: helix-turn-helix transcriptional regulator [Rhodobacteraceae bacterium]|nr:helix-turn-helix transcriptional regulator [Paracoccaceae bacterium]MCY4139026.1 helix-turn-helix transcriptional regulator [Paracoccaceae bacterium]